jgi:DNA-binding Lrp family transcriptional regulator
MAPCRLGWPRNGQSLPGAAASNATSFRAGPHYGRDMDSTDLDIIRRVGLVPFAGASKGPDDVRPAAIARSLGLGLDLVKDRVARMEEGGIIRGYEVYPNLHHLGLEDVTFHAELPREAKERVAKDAMLLDGVVGIYDYVGGHVCMQVLYRSRADLDRKVRLLMTLAGLEQPPAIYMQRKLPEARHKLSHLDWRIVQSLRGRAKRSFSEIADELGVSQRTVRRRVDRMTEHRDIDIVIDFDFGSLPGAHAFEIIVFCTPRATQSVWTAAVDLLRARYILIGRPPSPELGAVVITCFAFAQREIEAMRSAVDAIPGVDRTVVWFPVGGNYSGGWLDEAIQAMIDQTAPLAVRHTVAQLRRP